MKDPEQAKAFVRVMKRFASDTMWINRYKDRGFTDRTVKALIDCGIDFPERLLKMSLKEIGGAPGIGKAAIEEIRKYKQTFE